MQVKPALERLRKMEERQNYFRPLLQKLLLPAFTCLAFATTPAYGDGVASGIEGYWNEPGAGLDQTHEFLGKAYASNVGSVFIEIHRRKEGSFLWVPGLVLRIDSISIRNNAYVLDVVRTLGLKPSNPRRSGQLIIHILSEDKIWFEARFPEASFEEVFGGAFIELGIEHPYVRTLRKAELKK